MCPIDDKRVEYSRLQAFLGHQIEDPAPELLGTQAVHRAGPYGQMPQDGKGRWCK